MCKWKSCSEGGNFSSSLRIASHHSYNKAIKKMSSADIKASFVVKAGLARMLKGGVIMDVINVEQAKIAEAAGAVAVMALERIPADIRYDGGVARMSDPEMIREIQAAVTIPVMAKVSHDSTFSSMSWKQQNMTDIQTILSRPVSDTLLRHKFLNLSKLTTLMRAKYSQWLMRKTTSTRTTSKFHLYAAAEIWVRHLDASPKEQQCSELKARQEPETLLRQ